MKSTMSVPNTPAGFSSSLPVRAAHKMFDPQFADGRSIHTVAMDAGYSADWLRSNTGGGFETFDDMFMSWADFGSTCANLLAPDATHLGVAEAIDDDGKTYWSMLLGCPWRRPSAPTRNKKRGCHQAPAFFCYRNALDWLGIVGRSVA